MANFNLSIELTKLIGANRVTTRSGQEVIVVPLDCNPITVGKNGNVYLSLEAKEKKQVDNAMQRIKNKVREKLNEKQNA